MALLIPDDCIRMIGKYLNLEDFARTIQTCKTWKYALDTNSMFKMFYIRICPSKKPFVRNFLDWKGRLGKFYEKKAKQQQHFVHRHITAHAENLEAYNRLEYEARKIAYEMAQIKQNIHFHERMIRKYTHWNISGKFLWLKRRDIYRRTEKAKRRKRQRQLQKSKRRPLLFPLQIQHGTESGIKDSDDSSYMGKRREKMGGHGNGAGILAA